MNQNRRTWIRSALSCAALVTLTLGMTPAASAQSSYPEKPLRMIVPYPAGGGADSIARLIGQKLSERVDQPVVIENRPGASGMIGNNAVAKAPGDGHTMLLGITALVQIPSLYSSVPYELDELTPVSQIAKSVDVVFVPSDSDITSLEELVAKAKEKPGDVSVGSYGNATSSHLHIEQFNMKADTELMHVPYQGSGPEMTAILGGQIDSAFVDATAAFPYVDSDKVTPLIVTGSVRHPALPDIRTMGEAGYDGFEANGWFGMFLPSTTPQEIVDQLGSEVAAIVALPEVNQHLAQMGLIPIGSTPAEFASELGKDAAHWKSVVDAAEISIN